jgi:hypothetical protein
MAFNELAQGRGVSHKQTPPESKNHLIFSESLFIKFFLGIDFFYISC